ncbi:hypothetical protein RE428_11300 [Marinobacter nanhaiticus D15-8W]|uniref:Uncharacterized protein n=1 Tax=Marinobacter nanhaiticus D15-8W TaxID=626887 RepID=N6VRG1_9GAMM|nr:hypothetical protein [Marinobacter nanhaiticus]ENO12765.1 hypothetical protein J057_15245 [Marinobacter nanhaiticus D15-8W]BES70112.1 hypothetical protein RE428_11300 [Marinobacter nanhaiticus D15-8W]
MPKDSRLGPDFPRVTLYLPHRPRGLIQLIENPNAHALLSLNSNHWRKIVTLLAKIASPVADGWRQFRDQDLFRDTALGFSPELDEGSHWHWIGGKENLQRFGHLHHDAQPLVDQSEVLIDPDKRLLLTPYPDYRQLSNTMVDRIRVALESKGFYDT